MTKIFWDGAGYYAAQQYDTAYDGSAMIAYLKLESSDPYQAGIEARQRGLGAATWFDTAPQNAEIV